MVVDVAASVPASDPRGHPPPSPTLHEAPHDDEPDAIKTASYSDDDRRGSHSTAASLKATLKLPVKHDPAHEQPLPVETLGAGNEKELTDDDLDFPDGGLRAWSVLARLPSVRQSKLISSSGRLPGSSSRVRLTCTSEQVTVHCWPSAADSPVTSPLTFLPVRTFACFGMTNSWGVWQAHYMDVDLSGQSASSLCVPPLLDTFC